MAVRSRKWIRVNVLVAKLSTHSDCGGIRTLWWDCPPRSDRTPRIRRRLVRHRGRNTFSCVRTTLFCRVLLARDGLDCCGDRRDSSGLGWRRFRRHRNDHWANRCCKPVCGRSIGHCQITNPAVTPLITSQCKGHPRCSVRNSSQTSADAAVVGESGVWVLFLLRTFGTGSAISSRPRHGLPCARRPCAAQWYHLAWSCPRSPTSYRRCSRLLGELHTQASQPHARFVVQPGIKDGGALTASLWARGPRDCRCSRPTSSSPFGHLVRPS